MGWSRHHQLGERNIVKGTLSASIILSTSSLVPARLPSQNWAHTGLCRLEPPLGPTEAQVVPGTQRA